MPGNAAARKGRTGRDIINIRLEFLFSIAYDKAAELRESDKKIPGCSEDP